MSGRGRNVAVVARLVILRRGIWLDDTLGPEVAREITSLCDVIDGALMDALLALSMFDATYERRHDDRVARDAWEQDRQRRTADLDAAEPAAPGEPFGDRTDRLREQATIDVMHKRWAAGELPYDLAFGLPFMHARTFMTSLALLRRAIGELAKIDTGPARAHVIAARDHFDEWLPGVKPLRDSIEHAEDRMRGLGRSRKPLALAPIANAAINAPGGGVLVGDMLNNRHYGGTVADGSLVEVEIADATLEVAHEAVQAVFDALAWRPGHRRVSPSF
jgi:hypothetical protein